MCNVILILSLLLLPMVPWKSVENAFTFKCNALFSHRSTRLLLPLGLLPAVGLSPGHLVTQPHWPTFYGIGYITIFCHNIVCIFFQRSYFFPSVQLWEDNGVNVSLNSCFFSLRLCSGFQPFFLAHQCSWNGLSSSLSNCWCFAELLSFFLQE